MCKTRIQEEIEVLMSLYHLGKAPLSYALGFGEVTITRYLQGSTPHPDYAQVIHNALCDIDYMMGLVNRTMKRWDQPLKRQSTDVSLLNHNSPVQKKYCR